MKKFIALFICFALLADCIFAYAADLKYFYDGKWHSYTSNPISLQVNGGNVACDVPPLLFNNSTLVPVRAICEKIGAKISWDAKKSQVGVTMGNVSVLMVINNLNATVNGKSYKMLIPPKIVNSRTLIPVRFVSEALGLDVNWNASQRIVGVAAKSLNITDIQSGMSGSNLRITVSSDTAIQSYSTSEINDYPRLAVDINNALLKSANTEIAVNSNFVYKVRTAQNSKSPDITRIVADMKAWTGYKVTLSADKKQMYIDFDNNPTTIDKVVFSNQGNADKIDVGMKYSRLPVISNANGSTQITVDIPFSKLGSISQNIGANGNFVKTLQTSQLDATTARLIINTSGICLVQENKGTNGFNISLSPLANENLSYDNSDHPKFILRDERIGTNYFNYKYKIDQNKLTFTTPLSITDINSGEILIKDNWIDKIEINPGTEGSGTQIVVNGKSNITYKLSTVDNNNSEICIEAMSNVSGANYNVTPQILNKLVVIDPGHGGSETGATSNGIMEKDLNLDISLRLNTLLKNAGINVLMTRKDDTFVDLGPRADIANKANASLFVCVHNNAGNSTDNGTMTLYNPTVMDAVYNINPERAAQITQEELIKKLGTSDDGVWKRPNLVVLNQTNMPAILAEVSYVTNDEDRKRLLTDSFKQDAAQALYNSIIRILNEMVASQNSKK